MSRKTKDLIEPEVKAKVLEAARKILATHHPDKLTMDMIAQEAGLAKGTLYNYFKDKASLIAYIMAHTLEPYLDRATAMVASKIPALDKLRKDIELSLEMTLERQELVDVLLQSATLSSWQPMEEITHAHRRSIGLVREILSEGVRTGIFKDIPVEDMVLFYWGVVSSIGQYWLQNCTSPIADVVDKIMAIFLRGVARK